MKKIILSLIIVLALILTSCSINTAKEPDLETPVPTASPAVEPIDETVFEKFDKNAPNDTVALLLNIPSEEKLGEVTIGDSLTLDENGEQILIIPKLENVSIQIWSLKFVDEELVRDNLMYESRRTGKDFVLDTKVLRTEGAPNYKMIIYTNDSFAEYYFSYNGKDGNPEIEFITAKKYTNGDNFSFHEMGYMFTNKKEDIVAIFGEPKEKLTMPLLGDDTGTKLVYGETVFEIDNYNGKVYLAIIHDNTINHVRGVKVGDDMNSVLNKFPNSLKGEKIPLDGDRTYSVLYGEYKHAQDFGIIEYISNDPVTITYSNESSSVVFELSNGKVSKVRYAIPLT